jgi:hypothetical protein
MLVCIGRILETIKFNNQSQADRCFTRSNTDNEKIKNRSGGGSPLPFAKG